MRDIMDRGTGKVYQIEEGLLWVNNYVKRYTLPEGAKYKRKQSLSKFRNGETIWGEIPQWHYTLVIKTDDNMVFVYEV